MTKRKPTLHVLYMAFFAGLMICLQTTIASANDDSIQDAKLDISSSTVSANEINMDEPNVSKKIPFNFGLGGGAVFYTGNMHKLYSNSTVLDLRFGLPVNPVLDIKLGTALSKTFFYSDYAGYVDVNFKSVDLAIVAHMIPNKNSTKKSGLDPYLFLGATSMWKKHSLSNEYQQKYHSFGMNAGVGTNIFFSNQVGIWIEGKFDQNSFEDRKYSSYYDESYAEGLTGSIISSTAGIKYYF